MSSISEKNCAVVYMSIYHRGHRTSTTAMTDKWYVLCNNFLGYVKYKYWGLRSLNNPDIYTFPLSDLRRSRIYARSGILVKP